MPLINEWDSDAHSLAAVWKIEEPEAFFSAATGIAPAIKNEKRRIEHLAGRFLLQHVAADFPLHHIAPDEHDKPRLPLDRYFFSISHSFPYVAVVVSDRQECGIDIQTWHRRMTTLQHKFLSPEEQALFKDDPQLITLAWCVKEAAYKWNGRRGIDFVGHLLLKKMEVSAESYYFQMDVISGGNRYPIFLKGFIHADFALAFFIK